MNTKAGLKFSIALTLILASINTHGQDSTKTAQPKTTSQTIVKKPAYVPAAVKPAVQVPTQQAPATNQVLPAVTQPAVVDNSIRGQFAELLKKTYRYQQPALMEYNKNLMDTLNTEKRKFREAQTRLAAQAKVIANLQNNVSTKDQNLSQTQNKANEISFLGISLSKTLFSLIMWGLVLVLAVALATVIYLSGSNKHEAAYRIKLYEELDEEFKAYKVKANEKEKKLARELQTERNKVDELMSKK
jgi:hypothetical protein